MRTRALVIGVAAAGLLGGGLWLGRLTAGDPSAPAARAPEPRTARITPTVPPPPRVAPQARLPTLRAQRTSSTPGLTADLIDGDPRVRRGALRELARDPDVDPALVLAAARDRDLEVGVLATHALGTMYADGKIELRELIAIATEAGLNERVRINALNALALVAAPEAARLLTDLVAGGSTLERSAAAILLVHQDPEIAVPALIRALADADDNVRANALEALRARSRGRDFGSDAGAWSAWWQGRPR